MKNRLVFGVLGCWIALLQCAPLRAATVNVVYTNPGDGFDSPAAPHPTSPAPGATLGAQRKASFEAAADWWGFKLTSNVPIVVGAQMVPLSCNATSATLGSAGTTFIFRDFINAPLAGTWYHSALADKLRDVELNPTAEDVGATFNSSIDNNNACLNGINWYYDIVPGPGPAGTISFFDVVLHEIGHGVGVSTFVNLSTGQKCCGPPVRFNDIYMTFLEDHNLGAGTFWPPMNNNERRLSAIDGANTHFRGPAVQAMVNTGFLSGGVSGGHARVYAPNPLQGGSSISHWDTTMTRASDGASEIMEPFAVPGATFLLTNEMLEDLGWGPVVTVPVTLSSFQAIPDPAGIRFEFSTATEAGNLGFNLYVDTGGTWQRINETPIAAAGGDALEPRDYTYRAEGLRGSRFALEDLSTTGRTRRHGEFLAGRAYGRRLETPRIDWAAIGAEHEAAKRHRAVRRKGAIAAMELRTDSAGLYRVRHEDLLAAGLDLTGAPAAAIAISRGGAPVTRHVAGGAEFGPGSTIDFYAKAMDSLYTRTSVHRLSVDPNRAQPARIHDQPPRWIDPDAAERARRAIDADDEYSFASPNGDPWYLRSLLSFGSPVSAGWTLNADRALPGTASLFVDGWGVTDFNQAPDHHVLLRFNGEPVLDQLLDGREILARRVELAAGVVLPGDNEVVVELPGDTGVDFDLFNVESLALEYRRELYAGADYYEFEVESARAPATYPLGPDGIFGAGFESTGTGAFTVRGLPDMAPVVYSVGEGGLTRHEGFELAATGGGHELTVAGAAGNRRFVVASAVPTPRLEPARVVPDPVSGSAEYLIIAHADFIPGIAPLARHHRALGRTVRIVDVVDLYAHYRGGVVDPGAIKAYVGDMAARAGTRFVLLVGADTYDYHDNLGMGSISFLPTLYHPTHPVVEYAPVDPLFADTDGDRVPDLALGRLPVRTAAELASIVDKTLAYPGPGTEQSALFVADAAEPGTSYRAISDLRIAQLPVEWSVETAYPDDLGVAGARQVLLEALNRGVALSHFFGHSGPTVWTFDGLFDANDATALLNAGRPSVSIQWGCWNTYYVSPTVDTLAHKLLLSGDRGAAAVLGAATLTEVSSDKLLGGLLMPWLMTPGTTIGEAMVQAKQELARTRPDLTDVILGWTLLGDPGLVLVPE